MSGLLATIKACWFWPGTTENVFKFQQYMSSGKGASTCQLRMSGACSFSVAAPKIWNSLHLSVPVPVLIPSVFTSRPTTATRPSSPPNPSLHAPQFRLLQANVRVYKLYVLTYLLTTSNYYFTVKIALMGVFWRLFTVHANETDFISTLNSVWIGQSY